MLLRAGSKAVKTGRKRKRHEDFDIGAPDNVNMIAEEKKEPQA